jgi:virginiamycin B lyase
VSLFLGGIGPAAKSGRLGSGWNPFVFYYSYNQISKRGVGDVVDFFIPDSEHSTHEVTASPNGDLYFTQPHVDKIGRISTDGVYKLYSMPSGSYPHGLRFDANGDLWTSFEELDQIAKIDPLSGEVLDTISVAFPSAEMGAVGPHGLAIDSDGNIWYAGKPGDVVGKVNPVTRVNTQFQVQSGDHVPKQQGELGANSPINIYVDDQNQAWYVNLLTNSIGRVSTSGQISTFAITGRSTNNARPINVFQGPDGYIWVTQEGDNSASLASDSVAANGGIARFDPLTSSFINYAQPENKGAGGWLGAEPDTLWFQYQENALVRIEVGTSGITSQKDYPLPVLESKRTGHRITSGPDGNMWFTSLYSDTVSRITTDAEGIGVYSFTDKITGSQYLTALSSEKNSLLAQDSLYEFGSQVFLSEKAHAGITRTTRMKNRATGEFAWAANKTDIKAFKKAGFAKIGLDFAVYASPSSADHLIPIYHGTDANMTIHAWNPDPINLRNSGFTDVEIAWYSRPSVLG